MFSARTRRAAAWAGCFILPPGWRRATSALRPLRFFAGCRWRFSCCSRRKGSANANRFRCRGFHGLSSSRGRGAHRAEEKPGLVVSLFHRLFIFGRHPRQRRGAIIFLGASRSDRVGLVAVSCAAFWIPGLGGALAAAIGLGFYSQRGIGQLQRLLEGYNAQWMAGFLRPRTDPSQSMTAIGRIGRLKLSARIVIRLEPKAGSTPPVYLREASYRHYQSEPGQQTWFSGGSRSDFARLSHEPGNESAWTLLPGKSNTSTASISAYLEGRAKDTGNPEGLLPLPSGSGRSGKTAGVLAQHEHCRGGAGHRPGPGDVRRPLRPERDFGCAAGCHHQSSGFDRAGQRSSRLGSNHF